MRVCSSLHPPSTSYDIVKLEKQKRSCSSSLQQKKTRAYPKLFLVFTLQTVHFKVHDPKMHCKGSSRENTITRGGTGGGGGGYGHNGPSPRGGEGAPKYRTQHSRGGSSMGRYDEEAPPPLMHMMPPHPHMMMGGPLPPLGPPPMGPPLPMGAPPNNSGNGPPMPGPKPGPPANNAAPGTGPPDPPPPNPECDMKDLNKMFGMTASDIDKYSRVFFPVTFTCFQLMYWIIYQHLSDEVISDLVYLHPD